MASSGRKTIDSVSVCSHEPGFAAEHDPWLEYVPPLALGESLLGPLQDLHQEVSGDTAAPGLK